MSFVLILQNLRKDFETRKKKLEQLKKLVEETRGEVSPAILEKIEQKMAQLEEAWTAMEKSVVQSTISEPIMGCYGDW